MSAGLFDPHFASEGDASFSVVRGQTAAFRVTTSRHPQLDHGKQGRHQRCQQVVARHGCGPFEPQRCRRVDGPLVVAQIEIEPDADDGLTSRGAFGEDSAQFALTRRSTHHVVRPLQADGELRQVRHHTADRHPRDERQPTPARHGN